MKHRDISEAFASQLFKTKKHGDPLTKDEFDEGLKIGKEPSPLASVKTYKRWLYTRDTRRRLCKKRLIELGKVIGKNETGDQVILVDNPALDYLAEVKEDRKHNADAAYTRAITSFKTKEA